MDDYFGLLFKAMRGDKQVERVVAFIRRLLQMAFCNEANFTCACLLVVNEVLRTRPDVKYSVFQQGSKPDMAGRVQDSDDEEEVFLDADRIEEERKAEQK